MTRTGARAGGALAVRPARARAALLLALILTAAAALAPGCAALARHRHGGAAVLRLECNVPDAGLYIDDIYLGRADAWAVDGRLVRPGFHRVELRHLDHYTHYEELELAPGDAVLLRVTLHPLLD